MTSTVDFSGTRVLIVGDLMLDRYWWGSVARISPEAPVPVVRLGSTTLAAGGAANVAANVAGLGATPILLGVLGMDPDAEYVRQLLKTAGVDPGHLIKSSERPTTVKTRVIAHSQQVVRVDQESDLPIGPEVEDEIISHTASLISAADSLILSDYSKGLMTERVLSAVIGLAREQEKPVLVDPKGKDYRKYKGVSMITPNRREAAEACNLSESSPSVVDIAGDRLINELDIDSLLITQGEEGMTLFRRGIEPKHFPTAAREVYDVTGAGDTVIATLATAIGAGSDLEAATHIANIAAGSVVEQIGTTTITISSLQAALGGTGGSR